MSPLVMAQDATSHVEPSAAPPDHVWSPLVSNARKSRATRAAPPPEAAAGSDDSVTSLLVSRKSRATRSAPPPEAAAGSDDSALSPVVSRARKPLATRAAPPPEPGAAVAEHWQGRTRRSSSSGADEHMTWCAVHERQHLDVTRSDSNTEVSAQVYIASGYTPEASPRGQGVSPTPSPRYAHVGTRVLAGSAVSDTAGALGSPGPSDAAAQLHRQGLTPPSPRGRPVSIHARIAVACSPRCAWACLHDEHAWRAWQGGETGCLQAFSRRKPSSWPT